MTGTVHAGTDSISTCLFQWEAEIIPPNLPPPATPGRAGRIASASASLLLFAAAAMGVARYL